MKVYAYEKKMYRKDTETDRAIGEGSLNYLHSAVTIL